MSTGSSSLGASISSVLILLTDLILKTSDPKKKKKLRQLHKNLSKELKELIDRTVPSDTQAYMKATEALTAAIESVKEAKDDISRVAETIRKVAKAVDWIGKVAATVV